MASFDEQHLIDAFVNQYITIPFGDKYHPGDPEYDMTKALVTKNAIPIHEHVVSWIGGGSITIDWKQIKNTPTTHAGYGINDGGGGTWPIISGTPVDNQLAVWASATTLEGTSAITFVNGTLTVTGNIIATGEISAFTADDPGSSWWDYMPAPTETTRGGIKFDGTTSQYLRGDGVWATVTSGGNMTWPGQAGIAVYSGSSTWSDSITPSTGYLKYTGTAYSWHNFISGTPVDNQLAVWASATTLEGTSAITFVNGTLTVTGNIIATGEISAFTADDPGSSWWDNMPWATSTTIGGIIWYDQHFEKISNTFRIKSGILAPASHDLLSSHTITGQTPGQLLKVITSSTFGFATIGASDVGAEPAISKSTGYLTWTGSAWSFLNESYRGSTWVPSWSDITSKPNVTLYSGTCTDNQIAVFISGTTIESTSGITYDGTTFHIVGNITASGEISAFTDSAPANWWDNMPWATSTTIGGIIWYDQHFEKISNTFRIKSGILAPASHNLITSHTTTCTTGQFLKATGTDTFGWANILFNDIGNPNADKAWSMTSRQLKFTWTNPTTSDGAFELEASGNFSGDLFHIHQHTGNPNNGAHLIHAESSHANVIPLYLTGSSGLLMELRNPAGTYSYKVYSGAIGADRNLTLPAITGADTIGTLGMTQTWTGTNTFYSGQKINNPANTYAYTLLSGAIGGNYNLTLPLITGNDTLASLGLNQTFSGTQTFSAQASFSNASGIKVDHITEYTGSHNVVIDKRLGINTGATSVTDDLMIYPYSGDYTVMSMTNGGVRTFLASYNGTKGYAGTSSNHPFEFYTNDTKRIEFTAAGLINMTGPVNITSTTKTAGYFYSGTTDPTNTNRLNYDGYFYATKLYYGSSDINTVYAPLASPALTTMASITHATNPYLRLIKTGATARNFDLQIINDDFYITNQTSSTNNFFIKGSTGKIGIGNIAPDEMLHITGNIKVTGSIYASGEISAYSGTDPGGDWWQYMPWATSTAIGGIIWYDQHFEKISNTFRIKSGILAPASHDLLSSHTITGQTSGYFLKATSGTAFSFQQIGVSDVSGAAPLASPTFTGNIGFTGSYTTITGIPSTGNMDFNVAGAGIILKNESSTERFHIHMHGSRLRRYDGSNEYLFWDSSDFSSTNVTNWGTAYSHSQASHQTIISGTGFVKASGTSLSYDNSAYLTTAGTAADSDKLDGQHGSYYAPLASPTFTGTVTVDGGRPIYLASGGITQKGDSGGWAINYGFLGSSSAELGGFGALGNADALNYYYIGLDYQTNKMVLLANGNVGIGTTAPTPHSNGKALIISGYDAGLRGMLEIWDQAGGKSIIQSVGGSTYLGNLAKGTGVGNLYLNYGTGTTGICILGTNGNVGIGTNAPDTLFHVTKTTANGVGGFINVSNPVYADANGATTGINFSLIPGRYASIQAVGVSSWGQVNRLAFGATDHVDDTWRERMCILSASGNVGIGTTAPQTTLDKINSSARGLAISNSYPFIGFDDTDGGAFLVGTQANLAYLWNAGTSDMIFATNNAERMRLSSTGNLTVTGEVTAYSSSDWRFKQNIQNFSGLDMVDKLKPISFNWNDLSRTYNKEKNYQINYGLIAQDVENILPGLVHTTYDQYKSLDYIQLIPILIQAVKELKEEIKQLRG